MEAAEAALVTVPRNKIVFLNMKTELQCSTNSVNPIRWLFTSIDGRSVSAVFFIHENLTTHGEAKYKIEGSIRGQYNLVIESVDLSYAGRYKCIEGSLGPEVEVELAVIGKNVTSLYFVFRISLSLSLFFI